MLGPILGDPCFGKLPGSNTVLQSSSSGNAWKAGKWLGNAKVQGLWSHMSCAPRYSMIVIAKGR